MEDPSEEFVRLRDFVDAQNCLEQVKSMGCMEAVSKGFTDAMATEANQKLKLCKRQARRVYEILRLHFVRKAGGLTDKNAGYKDFRIDVKKRLNMPFQVRKILIFIFSGLLFRILIYFSFYVAKKSQKFEVFYFRILVSIFKKLFFQFLRGKNCKKNPEFLPKFFFFQFLRAKKML